MEEKTLSQAQKHELTKKALSLLSQTLFVISQCPGLHASIGQNNAIQGHLKEANEILEKL